MIITLDCSAAIEFVTGRPQAKKIKNQLEKADLIITPSLYIYELSNVMWKYHSINKTPKKILLPKISGGIRLIDQFIPAEDIFEEAISLSWKINHPAYDSMYLVTAKRKNTILLSIDEKLIQAAKKLNIDTPELI